MKNSSGGSPFTRKKQSKLLDQSQSFDDFLDDSSLNPETISLCQEIDTLTNENSNLINDIYALKKQFEDIQSGRSFETNVDQSMPSIEEFEHLKTEQAWLNKKLQELETNILSKGSIIHKLRSEALESQELIAKESERYRSQMNETLNNRDRKISILETQLAELQYKLEIQNDDFSEKLEELQKKEESILDERDEFELLCKIYQKKIFEIEQKIEEQQALIEENEIFRVQVSDFEAQNLGFEEVTNALHNEILNKKMSFENEKTTLTKEIEKIRTEKLEQLEQQRLQFNQEKELLKIEYQKNLEESIKIKTLELETINLNKSQTDQEQLVNQFEEKIKTIIEDAENEKKNLEINCSSEIQKRDEGLKNLKQDYLVLEEKLKGVFSENSFLKKEAKEMEENFKQQLAEMNQEKENYKQLFLKENQNRKKIHNKLIELQGNIRVICRVRPVLESERRAGYQTEVTEFKSAEEIIVKRDEINFTCFEFDRSFSPLATQQEVFQAVQPVIVSCMDGYNVCLFAYGQTGSGKTFTMEGPPHDRGVNFRALSELFEVKSHREEDIEYTFKISVLEIYNEMIRDLLENSNSNDPKKLEIRQSTNGNIVPGLTSVKVTTLQEAEAVMIGGAQNRAVGGHDLNERSSRSHSILTVEIFGRNLHDDSIVFSKLHLIDLAGSERLSKTDATGERLREAQYINKSLSALGDVISSLSMKNSHVPFRNSKLTHLLQDSLSGNSKVMMFVNCSPVSENLAETFCSLNFATRCRAIELGQAKKNIESNEVSKLKQYIKQLENEISSKDNDSSCIITPNEQNDSETIVSLSEDMEIKSMSKKGNIGVPMTPNITKNAITLRSTSKTASRVQKSTFK